MTKINYERPSLVDIFLGKETAREHYAKHYAAARTAKSAQGDEAEGQITDPNPVDDIIADAARGSKAVGFELPDGTRMTFPTERALAMWLAIQRRINKSHTTTESPMPINFEEIVKSYGITALAKHMVAEGKSFGVSEHQLVELATADAHRRNPESSPAVAFAAMYEKSAELRGAIEIAKSAAFEDAMTEELERDSREACAELSRIGKAKWPNLSPSQRFARAFETSPELAKRAHRRPGPTSVFPNPVAKDLAAPVYDPKPTFVGDDAALDVDDPREAVEQLKEAGRRRWPTASALEQFERALTDPENRELVTAAFRPMGSSPPRQR